jgi:hypothetical protein
MEFVGLVESFGVVMIFYLEILPNPNVVSNKLARRCVMIVECMLLQILKHAFLAKLGEKTIHAMHIVISDVLKLKNKHKLLFIKRHRFQLLFDMLLYL